MFALPAENVPAPETVTLTVVSTAERDLVPPANLTEETPPWARFELYTHVLVDASNKLQIINPFKDLVASDVSAIIKALLYLFVLTAGFILATPVTYPVTSTPPESPNWIYQDPALLRIAPSNIILICFTPDGIPVKSTSVPDKETGLANVKPAAGAAALVQVVPFEVKTFPVVLGATTCTAEVPLPKMTLLAVKLVAPVPPLATGSVPVT